VASTYSRQSYLRALRDVGDSHSTTGEKAAVVSLEDP
jgi:hypothetical protein